MNNPMSTTNGLGKDAFLQLMVTQMKYQDPMKPQDNSQFLAQLAQFTSLEQMTNIASTDSSMLTAIQSLQTMTQMNFVHGLIGTQVTVDDGNGGTITGTVSSVTFNKGTPELTVNGASYGLDALKEMR